MADERREGGMQGDEEERRRLEEERRRLEREIEEILRQKGEQPGRARRPHPSLPPISPVLANLARYVLLIAGAGVLLFLSVRVLGPRGLVFTFWALFIFFFFYTVRNVLMGIIRRRSR